MHAHNESSPSSIPRLIGAIVINGIIVVFELIFGMLAGSVALISDAIHNAGDVSGLVLSFWAEKVSVRPANTQKTYGYHKIEFVAAFANSIILSIAIAFIFFESLQRLFQPSDIAGERMFWIALIAFAGNTVATLLLRPAATENYNLKAAWLHSFQDALFSLAAMVGALFIHYLGWNIIDPIISMVICIFIAREIKDIIVHAINSLLDAVPTDIDFMKVKESLLKIENIAEVSDLHIWEISSGNKMLSVHVQTLSDTFDSQQIIYAAREVLAKTYDIHHATIQIVPRSVQLENCEHCN